jgi:uncharacterized protein YdhG (YjbR/CyaY superfamily)
MPATVDEYIAQFPDEVQGILEKIRTTIREAAPEAEERIGYGMPGYYQGGALVWFAAHKRHIGLYPHTQTIKEIFKEELSKYPATKGSIHFLLDQEIPYDLIRRIVEQRVEENLKR